MRDLRGFFGEVYIGVIYNYGLYRGIRLRVRSRA